jgi:hypothetical protein
VKLLAQNSERTQRGAIFFFQVMEGILPAARHSRKTFSCGRRFGKDETPSWSQPVFRSSFYRT